MQHPRLLDEAGSSSLEFTMLVSLFVAPILAASQQVTTEQLRQISLDAIAQSIARDFSIHESQARTNQLATQLALDSGIDRNLLDVHVSCLPYAGCSKSAVTASSLAKVQVDVDYRGTRAKAMQILDEQGSVMPLMLGCFALIFSLMVVGVNVQAATLYDQRASSLARFLANNAARISVNGDRSDVTALANQISKTLMFSSQPVERAWVDYPDSSTVTARVCLGFSSPLDLIAIPVSRACAAASVRRSN